MNEDIEEKSLIIIPVKNTKLSKIFTFLIIPIILEMLMILTFNKSVDIWYYLKPKIIIFTGILLLLFHTLLIFITGNSKRSVIIQALTLWLLLFINKLRYTYTYEPLTFADFVYSGNAGELITLIKGSILEVLWGMLPVFISLAIVLVFLVWMTTKINFKINKSLKFRIVNIGILIMIFIVLFMPNKTIKDFMFEYIYDRYSQKDYAHNSSNAQYYSESSMLGGMYADLLDSRVFKPDNYDKEELNKILTEVPENSEENLWEKSNIIVTFSESFFDVSVLEDDIKFSNQVTPNFNRLKNEGIFVNIISPSYGGVSANVEFEFLTGYSLNFFGRGYTPFMQLYKNNTYANRPSLIKELNNNGYYTKVVFGKDFYNSENVYKRLGIDEYEEKNIKSEYNGYYTSDEYLIDGAINALENKKDNEKLFYMNCTIESHMPFKKEKYDNYDISIESSTLSASMTDVVLSYSQSCYNADKQLGRLYDYIQTVDEPTILIFFGDHLPYLTDTESKEDILNYLSYFNTEDELLNSYRKYNTQALILANFDLGEDESINYLSPDMLLTTVLNKMDIEVSDYYRWLYSTKDSIPCTNYLVSADSEGNLYWTESLEGDKKEVLDLREKMQYNVLIED